MYKLHKKYWVFENLALANSAYAAFMGCTCACYDMGDCTWATPKEHADGKASWPAVSDEFIRRVCANENDDPDLQIEDQSPDYEFVPGPKPMPELPQRFIDWLAEFNPEELEYSADWHPEEED